MSMPSLPSGLPSLENATRRRAHLIAGTCVVALVYALLVLFVRLVVL